jgi:hypothetical protein
MVTDILIQQIDNSIEDAFLRKSKCTTGILNIEGMCGTITRHLYNNLCSINIKSFVKNNYLEIGCCKGASTVSSLYKNNLNATVIDNWSEFGGSKFVFIKNVSKYIDKTNYENIQIISQDCFHLKTDTMLKYSPYNFFLYDGSHSEQDHFKSIVNFWNHLDNICIIIIDDWNWLSVRNGTYKGLNYVGANVVYKRELYEPNDENKSGLWNGCCIFLIQK